MGIRSKQLAAGTFTNDATGRAPFGAGLFDAATVGTVFGTASIADAKLVETYINQDGAIPMAAALAMGTNKITGLADGTAATDAVNKSQLDAAVAGISWAEPVAVKELVGSALIATINGLSPTAGDAYVALDAGTPTAGSSDLLAIGSIAEFDGTAWQEIVAGVGGFPPVDTRALAATQTALNNTIGLTDGADDGSYLTWDGANLNPTKVVPIDGDGVLVAGETSLFENKAYVFDGVGATGSWIQFSAVAGTTARQEAITTEAITGNDPIADQLTFTPESQESLSLFLNGVQVINGTDYTFSGTVITWLAAGAAVDLAATDTLIAYYRS